jgi:uncharacterized protein YndB with AHSA1/START domain
VSPSSGSIELLASRADVWSFLAEPYHLTDWWPSITGVEPDRRGFAPGARWKVIVTSRSLFVGPRGQETQLLIREIDLYERWSWHILATKLDVEIRLRATAEDRTEATITVSKGSPRAALKRLFDLCQTAATL